MFDSRFFIIAFDKYNCNVEFKSDNVSMNTLTACSGFLNDGEFYDKYIVFYHTEDGKLEFDAWTKKELENV